MAKKVSAIVSLSIIGILIIATIIMANVQCSYGVNFKTPNMVAVSYSNTNAPVEPETDAKKNEIISLINNASKENALTAMFSGTLFDTAEVTKPSSNANTIKHDNNKFYVYLTYGENNPQKLMVGNKEYKDSEGRNYYYKDLVFEVSNTDGVAETKVYIIPSYKPNTNNEPYNDGGYYMSYNLKANFSKLYKYLEENFK